jgi:hypothetical protein
VIGGLGLVHELNRGQVAGSVIRLRDAALAAIERPLFSLPRDSTFAYTFGVRSTFGAPNAEPYLAWSHHTKKGNEFGV